MPSNAKKLQLWLFLLLILISIEKYSTNIIANSNSELKSSKNEIFNVRRVLARLNPRGNSVNQPPRQPIANQGTNTAQNANIQGNANTIGQAADTTSTLASVPISGPNPLSPGSPNDFINPGVSSTPGVNQAANIQGNNNVAAQSGNTNLNTLSMPIGVSGYQNPYGTTEAAPVVNSNTAVNQNAAIQGSGNVIGQSANTNANTYSIPIGTSWFQSPSGNAASGVNSNTGVTQNSAIQGNFNVVGQSANTSSNALSMPIGASGFQNPYGNTGTVAGVNSNAAVNQNSNIQGDYNTVGQVANTGINTVSMPIGSFNGGSGTGYPSSQSGVNSMTNVGQTSNIIGSGNVVGQEANTQSNTASIPISYPLTNFGGGSGFVGGGFPWNIFGSGASTGGAGGRYPFGTTASGTAAASVGSPYYPGSFGGAASGFNVNPNANVGQQSQISGSGNVVGQVANTNANTASIPTAVNLPTMFQRPTNFGFSNVLPTTNVNQNSAIQGSGNVVGQSATTQNNAISVPVMIGPNSGGSNGLGSSVGSNVGVNQASSITGDSNVVGQQANAQSGAYSVPISQSP